MTNTLQYYIIYRVQSRLYNNTRYYQYYTIIGLRRLDEQNGTTKVIIKLDNIITVA